MRIAYYEIPRSAYLFRNGAAAPDSTLPSPEEPVRQWCAFELIRAYQIPLTALEFESSVKVGSKTYRIDILVRRESRPWIVVECKESSFKKGEDAIRQAISYADARDIQAEFAAYTNGFDWLVARRVRGEWVRIPDLPALLVDEGRQPLLDLLVCIHEVAPLVYKLDERLQDREAECFLSAMQRFFYGGNLLTDIVSKQLYHALDNLLRILSAQDAHPKYQWEKLKHAWHDWERYRKICGLEQSLGEPDDGDHLPMQLSRLQYEVQGLLEGAPKPYSGDALLIRLSVALLDYADMCSRRRQQFLEIPPQVHQTLREFLDLAFTVQLNVSLPDHIDTGIAGDVKSYCCLQWNSSMDGLRRR